MLNRQLGSFVIALMFSLPAFAEGSPGQAYLDLHKKELAARSYSDILPLRAKGSVDNDKMSAKEQEELFPLFKSLLPQDVKVLSETITGNAATLKVTAAPDKGLKAGDTEVITGVVELLKENGEWKLNREKWDSKSTFH